MSKYTRLATTINARYVEPQGAADGFYLDGRMSNPARYRDIDVTLDRADDGFYLAIFASADQNRETGRAYLQRRRSLDRICELIKDESRGNIDAAINDMAENALHVAGRLTLGTDEARLPYYSGILVRDSEMAAVTMGNAQAYLYRDEALYPLTQDDFKLEPIDARGQKIDNFDIFGAGKAGTIRYSNISQLQVDDCVILCTREVMEVIGQRGLLELLDRAYDQQEAAEMVADAMESARPGKPYQFMMSFVEDIYALSRRERARRDTTVHKGLAAQVSSGAMTDETVRFDPKQMVSPYSAAAAGLVPHPAETAKAQPEAKAPAAPQAETSYRRPEETAAPKAEAEPETAPEEQPAAPPVVTSADASEVTEEKAKPSRREEAPAPVYAAAAPEEDYEEDEEDEEEEPRRKKGSGRVLLTILILILLSLGFVGVWYLLTHKNGGSQTQQTTPPTVAFTETTTAPAAPVKTTGAIPATTAKQTPSTPAAVTTTVKPDETTPAETTAAGTTSEGAVVTATGAEGGSYQVTYKVQPGDTLYGIVNSVYSSYDLASVDSDTMQKILERFVQANPDTISGSVENDNLTIYADTTLNIPDISDLVKAN